MKKRSCSLSTFFNINLSTNSDSRANVVHSFPITVDAVEIHYICLFKCNRDVLGARKWASVPSAKMSDTTRFHCILVISSLARERFQRRNLHARALSFVSAQEDVHVWPWEAIVDCHSRRDYMKRRRVASRLISGSASASLQPLSLSFFRALHNPRSPRCESASAVFNRAHAFRVSCSASSESTYHSGRDHLNVNEGEERRACYANLGTKISLVSFFSHFRNASHT